MLDYTARIPFVCYRPGSLTWADLTNIKTMFGMTLRTNMLFLQSAEEGGGEAFRERLNLQRIKQGLIPITVLPDVRVPPK